MPCATHPDRGSVARCVTCGTELCADCSHEVAGRFYCEAHAPAAQSAAPEQPPEPTPAAEAPAPAVGVDDKSKDNPTLAVLAYVLPFVLNLAGLIVPVVVLATDTKRSRYMRFHALQSIFVFLVGEAAVVATSIVTRVIRHMPIVGGLVSALAWLALGGAWLALTVYLAAGAYNRKEARLPVVTQLAADQADKMAV